MGLFGRKKKGENPSAAEEPSPTNLVDEGRAAFLRGVQAQIEKDPMLGNRLASKEVLQRLLDALKNDRGVQIEAVATVIGAFAGRACHLAAHEGVTKQLPEYAGRGVMAVQGADGETYMLGDAINWPLAEREFSVWALVAGFAQSKGSVLPDLMELFSHSAATLGGPEFGRPRYAEGTGVGQTPAQYLVAWEPTIAHVVPFAASPQQWPIVFGLAAQELFEMTKGQFDLEVLTRIVMDSAIATSKIRA